MEEVNETKSNVNVKLITKAEDTASGDASGYLNIFDYYWLADIYSSSPIFYINSDMTITGGNGTANSPYTLN